MKEIQLMMSFNPIWALKISNGEKEIELRKSINYKWAKEQIEKNGGFYVNMYVTLGGKGLVLDSEGKGLVNQKLFPYAAECPEHKRLVNGKVIGRFWCDKVEKIENYPFEAPEHPRGYQIAYDTPTIEWDKLCGMSCLSRDEMFDYFGRNDGYALHVAKGKVEIFENPKYIRDFCNIDYEKTKLKKAPQSWCYVEGN